MPTDAHYEPAVIIPEDRKFYANVVTTTTGGTATLTFPAGTFTDIPIVTATPVGDGGTTGTFVEITSVTAAHVVLQAWDGTAMLIGGLSTVKAGAGVAIHVHATVTG